jgi:hypothetical protein
MNLNCDIKIFFDYNFNKAYNLESYCDKNLIIKLKNKFLEIFFQQDWLWLFFIYF